jgi:outer membrane protein
VVPSTVTLQYHVRPGAKVRPYVGAGLSYALLYAEDASRDLERAIG